VVRLVEVSNYWTKVAPDVNTDFTPSQIVLSVRSFCDACVAWCSVL